MKTPLVSIIIPVYNSGNRAEKIISQVVSQKFNDYELLIIDDGSTDESAKLLEKAAEQSSKIKVYKKKNGGASSARNYGINKSSGKYLMFLDSDDEIRPSMIQALAEAIMKNDAELAVCGIQYVTIKDGKQKSSVNIGVSPVPRKTKQESFAEYVVKLLGIDGRLYNPCNKIYLSDIIKDNHIRFEEGLDFGEDLTFNLRYLKFCKNIEFIKKPLYIYNFDASSGTFGKSSLIYENRQKNYQELLEFAGTDQSSLMVDLLGWVKHYWFLSFCLSVASSKLSFSKKNKKFKHVRKIEKLQLAKKRQSIGNKKYFIEIVIKVFKTSTFGLFVFSAILDFLKNSQLCAKVWRKLQVS